MLKKSYTFIFLFIFSLYSYSSVNACLNYSIFPKTYLNNDELINLEADKSSMQNRNLFFLEGNAKLVSKDYAVNANSISINKINKSSISQENVRFNDDSFLVKTEKLDFSKRNGLSYIITPHLEFSIPEKKIRGSADGMEGDSNLKVLKNATYTSCPLNNYDWKIESDEVALNNIKNRGLAKNAILKLDGIPLLYHPKFEWVLSGKGTGVLAPSFASYTDVSSSRAGYKTSVPYFLNIAPDRDLLLTLSNLTTRGQLLNAKYRTLIYYPNYDDYGRFETEIGYLPMDSISEKKRWKLKNNLDLSLNSNTKLNLHSDRVSDKDYYKNIVFDDRNESLLSYIKLINENNDLNFVFYAESEQVINDGLNGYEKKPEIVLSKTINFYDLDLALSSSFSSFKHKVNSTNGDRYHLKLDLSKSFVESAYTITPSLQIFNTNYKLSDIPDADRTIYNINIDSKLNLERDIKFSDTNYIQTLVPTLSYSYTPKKEQSAIPNFDSEAIATSYDSLFESNSYTGIDKITNQNSFSIGLQSEFINDDSGETNLILKAGQKLYLDNTILNSQGVLTSNNESERGYSNIFTSLEFFKDPLVFKSSIEYDPLSNNIANSRSNLNIFYNPRSFLNLDYIYDFYSEDDLDKEYVTASGSHQLNSLYHFFWKVNKNLTTEITDNSIVGISRESCCIAYRFGFFKTTSNNYDHNYQRHFEIVFKGLTSSSPYLRKKLEKEIPNYIGSLDYE